MGRAARDRHLKFFIRRIWVGGGYLYTTLSPWFKELGMVCSLLIGY